MGDITANFNKTDYQCRCGACASNELRPATKDEVVQAVQRVRDRLGLPLSVSRGVSCSAHNAAIGGAPDSRHLPEHADAVDIVAANSIFAAVIVAGVLAEPVFTAIRVYDDHVHADARPGPRRFIASPE